MTTLIEDIGAFSAQLAKGLAPRGYRLDFTPRSFWEVERFFAENMSAPGAPTKTGHLNRDLGKWMFGFGAYIGEVIRETLDADWITDDSDLEGEINIRLRLPDGAIIWPVQRVMKRYGQGLEDGDIVGYAVALGLDVGPNPAPLDAPKKRRFGRS